MLNHYLLLIYRNFIRAKSYFMINLIGLSTGLGCTLFIFLWVRDEFRINKYTLSVKDHNVKAEGYHVGKDFFEIFSYKLLQGEASQVLQDKLGMVISKALAIKLFGTHENVVGKMVDLQHEKTFQVSGV